MPLKITSDSALLTAGQAVTLQAEEDASSAATVSWTVTPPLGSLSLSPSSSGQKSSTATYVAPAIIQTEQNVAITATSESGAVSVTISLTPNAILIVPPVVELRAGQKQKFTAIVASGTTQDITWVIAPYAGKLDLDPNDSSSAIYTAEDPIKNDGALTVTAVCRNLGKQASSTITLTPEPWRGIGPTLLAAYLLLVFVSVYLMIAIWPTGVQNLESLKTTQAQAQSDVDKSELALQKAKDATGSQPGSSAAQGTAGLQQQLTEAYIAQLKDDLSKREVALDDVTKKLNQATSPTVPTSWGQINREIDLIYLILLSGVVGSFLHMAQSFSDFAGNRTLKSSWLWWYCFLPFIGAGLALALYTGLRGGLITVASTSAINSTDLNPYGLVAGGILAGLFSKQATKKLGEVFETVFLSGKSSQTKDPLKPDSSGAAPPATPAA